MKYIFGFIVFSILLTTFSLSPVGKVISTVVIIFIVGLFIMLAISSNKGRDESDREKYQDKDKPYFNQKISSYRDDGQSSPRWLVWLGVLVVPIMYGLVFLLID